MWEETHAVTREHLPGSILAPSRGHKIWGVASSLFLLLHRHALGTRGTTPMFPEATVLRRILSDKSAT